MGEFTVQQWKAASACRECQAKRLTVEAQNNGTAAQRALQAEAELRNANADLIAKAARCALVINGKSTVITKLQLQLKTQQELVIATEKSRVEMQKNASAAAKASTALQNRLEKTEASCIRLMNAAEDREKILAAPAHVEPKVDVEPKAMAKASPKRKLKTDADRFESKAKVSPKRKIKTDVGLFVEAQRAYPLEHGESGAGRQQRGRDIQKYYAGLLRERDKQATKSSKSKKSKFFRSSEFNGARPGFVFKTGSKGVGYYAEVKDGRNAKCSTTTTDSSQQPQTVFGTDSEADEDQAPPTPPNFDEIEVDNGKDAMEDLTSSLQSSAVSQHVDDFVSPCEHQQEETTAKGLQRLDNGHWGRCGKPHPQSAFQTGPSSPSASQSSSSSNSTYLRKKGLCKTTKKPKASKRKVVQPPPSCANSESETDDSVMDLSCLKAGHCPPLTKERDRATKSEGTSLSKNNKHVGLSGLKWAPHLGGRRGPQSSRRPGKSEPVLTSSVDRTSTDAVPALAMQEMQEGMNYGPQQQNNGRANARRTKRHARAWATRLGRMSCGAQLQTSGPKIVGGTMACCGAGGGGTTFQPA
jgi:hypothetical protein